MAAFKYEQLAAMLSYYCTRRSRFQGSNYRNDVFYHKLSYTLQSKISNVSFRLVNSPQLASS